MASIERPDILLYTESTPNCWRVSIALEELGLPYRTQPMDLSIHEQKQPWFLQINPNGRIPAITDRLSDGKPINIFESGSILQYLVEEYDIQQKISYPKGSREHYEVNNWLFFLVGGVGPMQGQANHFLRYSTEKIPYSINRYVMETKRLYNVLNKHLQSSRSGYIVGEHISIADIALIGWVNFAGLAGVDIDEFPALKRWEDMISARPAVQRGFKVPRPLDIKETLRDKNKLDALTTMATKFTKVQNDAIHDELRRDR